MSDKPPGKIITFYSYKGGTGRSMALANVAWLLASSGKKVLVVDWDLEAPGLHRYFSPFLLDKEMAASDGLINFVDAYATEAIKPLPAGETIPKDWYRSFADLNRYALTLNWKFPYGGGLDFIPAGRQAPSYSTLVNFFDWKNLYERLGGWQFFETAKEQLRKKYDYILLDSRTGVSDTSGICTVQMPDALVVCFTYNNQSIRGASAIVHDIYKRRVKAGPVVSEPSAKPPLQARFHIFPLPTRVEQAEQDKLGARRSYAWSMFDQFLDIPDLNERRIYWNEVEVPYIPFFAFEEILAPFKEETHDPRSFIASLMRLTKRLALEISDESLTLSPTLLAPEERQRILQEFAHTPEVLSAESAPANVVETESEAQVRRAETLFMRSEPTEQAKSQRIFTRLVRVVSREEGGEHGRRSVEFDELGLPSDDSLVRKLVDAHLLNFKTRRNSNLIKVELASEGLIRNWGRLRNWIESDLDFLVWRQRLGDTARDWEKSEQNSDFVYSGNLLQVARAMMAERRSDLNSLELAFIEASISVESQALKDSHQRTMTGGGRVFIIRPFGEKPDPNGMMIDFDKVENELIAPALKELDLEGGTTGEVMKAGNIREDMFQLLLTADLVIADVSIDNANVFYELGIRQALRDKKTVLLRSKPGKAQKAYYDLPFDIKTDRYLAYDRDDPAASINELVRTLNVTINGDAQDSPVFKLLPQLQAQDHSRFLAVPMDFREEVERALANESPGDLEMLAEEVSGFGWMREGLRLVGRAQFGLRAFMGAWRSWEGVRDFVLDDLEANQKLATIYQRLGDLDKSDLAAERALKWRGLNSSERAEVRALRGSNEKARWRDEWEKAPPEQQRSQALRSVYLSKALNEYEAAFEEDLNHYYAGFNALAMCVIQARLAEILPEVWAEGFETDQDAQRELEALRKKIERLTAGVELSLRAARKHKTDIWAEISQAGLVLLTSKRPARVATSYRQAMIDRAEPFVADAERRQLQLYERLGILTENVKSALEVLPPASVTRELKKQRILLFAGHMLDQPGRVPPRFPPEKEEVARQAIRDKILVEQEASGGITYGIAGCAHGGDILFHEVCAELGIKTELWLALPPEKYVTVAVQNYVGIGTNKLVERFRQLQRQLTPRWMADDLELPRWLRAKPGYDFWQRYTLWMVYNAFRTGAENLTLIALWDGEEASGIGDFVRRVMERGGKIALLSTKQLFNL